MAWGDLKDEIDDFLKEYRPLFKRYVKKKPHKWEGSYWDDWTDHLRGPEKEYHGDDTQERDWEVNSEYNDKKAAQVAALFPEEYDRFRAWLVDAGHPNLYAEFEGQLHQEHAAGLYPGGPVSQLRK